MKYIDELGDFPEEADVKLPPQVKGKLEYHPTPKQHSKYSSELLEITDWGKNQLLSLIAASPANGHSSRPN